MLRTVELIRVFISSPSDVAEERNRSEAVIGKLNLIYDKQERGIRLVPLRWEESAYPTAAATYTQAEITRQIGDYEIYVGILGERFGTSTPMAGSGTEEEFNNACDRFNSNPTSIRILFYFKDVDTTQVKDAKQFAKVSAFRDKLKQSGNILYWSYGLPEVFSWALLIHLAFHIEDYRVIWGPLEAVEAEEAVKTGNRPENVPDPEALHIDYTDEDVDFLDPESLYNHLQSSTAILDDVAARLEPALAYFKERVDTLQRELGTLRKEGDRQIVAARLGAEAIKFAHTLDSEVDIAVDALRQGFRTIAYLTPYWTETLIDNRESLRTALVKILALEPQLIALHSKLTMMRATIPEWPSYLKRAKPKVDAAFLSAQKKLAQAVQIAQGATVVLNPLAEKLDSK